MSSLIQLKCKECGIEFPLAKKEFNRQVKKGRAPDFFFCSLSCAKTHTNRGNTNYKNIPNWKQGGEGRSCDELSPFRYYARKARTRAKVKGYDTNITTTDVREVWDKQNGRCAFTGMPLTLRNVGRESNHKHDNIKTASLDRIDSTKGYIKGNVQFISAALNLAKQDMPDPEFRQGLAALFEHYQKFTSSIL